MFQHLLIPLDGSHLAEQAIPMAEEVAQKFDSQITLIRVIQPYEMTVSIHSSNYTAMLLDTYHQIRLEAESYLKKQAEILSQTGCMLETRVVSGQPAAAAILDQAEHLKVDAIVMGTHGRSGLGRWMYGSVADKVLRHADVPVLLIRSKDGPPEVKKDDIRLEDIEPLSAGPNQDEVNTSSVSDEAAEIHAFITDLGSADLQDRKRAAENLIAVGQAATSPLLTATTLPNPRIRWEATNLLGQIGGPEAITTLINCLEDDVLDVRWRAAESLIAIGPEVIPFLLKILLRRPTSVWLREGAQHILPDLRTKQNHDLITPVIEALQSGEPGLAVPLTAHRALKDL